MPKTAVIRDTASKEVLSVVVEGPKGLVFYEGNQEIADMEAESNSFAKTIEDVLGSGYSYLDVQVTEMSDEELKNLTAKMFSATSSA